jgi:uncharacterized protein YgiM (DUF1202 family)
MPVEPFAIPIPVSDQNLPNFGRLSAHIIAAVNDFNARGDVYDYGPTVPPTQPTPLFQVRVIASALNVRSGPGGQNPLVRTVTKGTILDVWEVNPGNGWYKVSATQSEWVSGSSSYTQKL